MKTAALAALLGTTAFLAACGSEPAPEAAPDTAPQVGMAGNADAASRPVALGLSEAQLLDSDIIDAAGMDVGDVEGVMRGSTGAVDRLRVEVEDSEPDHFVDMPLDGLTAVQDGDDWDIRTSQTREDLLALPAAVG